MENFQESGFYFFIFSDARVSLAKHLLSKTNFEQVEMLVKYKKHKDAVELAQFHFLSVISAKLYFSPGGHTSQLNYHHILYFIDDLVKF